MSYDYTIKTWDCFEKDAKDAILERICYYIFEDEKKPFDPKNFDDDFDNAFDELGELTLECLPIFADEIVSIFETMPKEFCDFTECEITKKGKDVSDLNTMIWNAIFFKIYDDKYTVKDLILNSNKGRFEKIAC